MPYQTWSFGESIAMEACWAYGRGTGREAYRSFVHGYLRGWAARAQPFARLDCTAPGRVLVDCYRATGDKLLMDVALELAEYLVRRDRIDGIYGTWEHSPLIRPYGGAALDEQDAQLLAEPPAGAFIDCLHFDPPLYAALGRELDSDRWTNIAVDQAQAYIDVLRTSSGLFDHFVLDGVAGTFGHGWGRGQGWAILGLLDVAAELPDGQQQATELVDVARQTLRALADRQRPDGHWSAVVTDDDGEVETSTAAFFVIAVDRLGAAADDRLSRAATLARAAVLRSVGPDGVLAGVSAAVMASTVEDHYRHVPTGFTVPWGQGPALLAVLGAEDVLGGENEDR